jgi:hypothetical protein
MQAYVAELESQVWQLEEEQAELLREQVLFLFLPTQGLSKKLCLEMLDRLPTYTWFDREYFALDPVWFHPTKI